MTTKRAEPKGSERKHEPTPQEQAAIENYRARQAAIAPSLKFDKERARFSPDHPQEAVGLILLMEALGTADLDFLNGLLRQLTNVSSPGEQIDEGALNFMVSVVKGIQPRDQVEAMLAAQMAAVHRATMTFALRLALVTTIPQQDSAERAFNKLARTFASQMEALKRYRSGGEQKLTVQNVSVNDGGQAIVGSVTQAPREAVRDGAAGSPPALVDSPCPPMAMLDEPSPAPIPFKRKTGR